MAARDQGKRQTCVAFAIAGIQGYFAQHCLSPEYAYHATALQSPNWQPDQGLDVRIAVGATAPGLPEEQHAPYQSADPTPPLPPLPNGHSLRGPQLALLPKDPTMITGYLHAGHPVGVLIALTRSFMSPVDGVVTFEPGVYPGLHAVMIVGYGADSSGESHYLICNSWGTGWGINGHAWISETYLRSHTTCAYGVN